MNSKTRGESHKDDIVNIFVPYRTKEHYSKAIDGDKAVATELTAEQKEKIW